MLGHDRQVMLAKRWGKNLLQFFLFSLVDGWMIGLSWVVYLIEFLHHGKSATHDVSVTLLWIFATPAMLAEHRSPSLSDVLMWASPIINGGVWWIGWRMWALFLARRKPK